MEFAKSSILLAMNMLKITLLQRQIQDDRLHIEDAGHPSTSCDEINRRSIIDVSTGPHDLMFFTKDITTIWRIIHSLASWTEPNTRANRAFARVAAPKPHEEFHA